MKLDKKSIDTLKLATKKGNDADLLILNELHEEIKRATDKEQELEGKIDAVNELRQKDRQELTDIIQNIPAPLQGEKGEQGESIVGPAGPQGKDGQPGRDAVSPDIEEIINEVLSRIPKPENGKDGQSGPAGKDAKEWTKEELIELIKPLVPKSTLLGARVRDIWLSFSTLDGSLVGAVNGTNKTFNYPTNIIAGSEFIYSDGLQLHTSEYTFGNKSVTLNMPPNNQVSMKAQKL